MKSVIDIVRAYKGKEVIISTVDGDELRGILLGIDKSKHGGIGSIYIKTEEIKGNYPTELVQHSPHNDCLIRGSAVLMICLEPNKYEEEI